MNLHLPTLLRGPTPLRRRDIAKGVAGAFVGIAATGVAAQVLRDGHWSAAPLLIPPIGASAVLVFAVPASPLAQPRSVIGGNVLSALVGVGCALLIPQPALAAAAAVALAILGMSLLGCLHPPGGAVALGVALAAHGGKAPLLDYALAPVGLCSVLLVVAAVLFNRAVGRSYPHRAPAPASLHGAKDSPPLDRVGFTAQDLDAALAHYSDLLDVSRDDLDALFRQVELEAHQRIHAQIRCEDVMSRDVIAVHADQSAESAFAFLQRHDLRTASVVDERRRVVGMVRRAELLAGRGKPVEAVLDPFVHKVRPSTPIQSLLPLLSSGQTHEAMVVDEQRVLVGVITQTDLLAVLYRAHIVEAVAAQRAA